MNRNGLVTTSFLVMILSLNCDNAVAQSIQLTDVSENCGVNFVHSDGSYGQRFVIEVMSGGLALLDYDNDGDLDIYFLNGAPIRKPLDEPPARDALFRNDGDFKFSQVTLPAGLGDTAMGLGVGWADYDNDGFADLYLNNYGPNVLYHNCGDGTYEVVTDIAGVSNGNLVGGGVAFFDKDNDGDLDLYVASYVKFDPSTHRIHIHKGVPAYPSPLSYEPEKHTLFENNGDGTFQDVSESSGIHAVAGRGMGVVAFDYDDDGDVDVFVANDTQENFLFQNDGKGKFEEVALTAGVAYDSRGRAQASMGVDILDADHDGRMDLFVTAFSEEFAPLYRNLGNGFFEDVTLRAGTSTATFPHVTWGIVAEDFDNDGTDDIYVGCGDLDDNKSQRGGTNTATAFNVENVLLQGIGKAKFKDLKKTWGSGALVARSTRGVVAGDLNSDGLVDVITLNERAAATVLRNETKNKNAYITLQLIGTRANRDSVGAVVTIEQDGRKLVNHVISGHSYQSDSGRLLHFGLFGAPEKVTVQVKWPNGSIEFFEPPTNSKTALLEGFGVRM